MVNISRAKMGAAVLFAVMSLLVAMLTIDREPQVPAAPITVDAAERVLDEAVRLARAGDYAGLCQSVALPEGTCNFLLRDARDRGLAPDSRRPQVTQISRPREARIKFRIQGFYSDGVKYVSDFIVVQTEDGEGRGQLRTVTPVYWSPMGSSKGNCATEPGGASCSIEPQVAPKPA